MTSGHHRTAWSGASSSGSTLRGLLSPALILLACVVLFTSPGIAATTQAVQMHPALAGIAAASPPTASTVIAGAGSPPNTGPTTNSSILSVPADLPLAAGCYYHATRGTGWQAVSCTSQAQTSALPKPQIGGSSGIDGLSIKGKILTEGFTTAWFTTYSGEKDTSWGADSFSIQANTNGFTGSNGQLDSVQFTEQYSPQGVSQDCVWNIDVTTQNYANTCVNTPAQPLSKSFGADVVGTTSSEVLCIFGCITIWLVTSTYMTPSGTWAVTAADTYGLHSHWTQISGTILGLGGGSQAVFTHPAKLGSVVGAYSPGLNSATTFNTGLWTDESNNLSYLSTSSTCYGDGYCDLTTEMGN
jgi:hypothetical protein